MIKITYERSLEDLVNFNIFHVWKSPDRKYFRLLFFVGIPFLLILILFLALKVAGMPLDQTDYTGFGIILAILIIVFMLMGGGLIQRTLQKKIAHSIDPSVIGKITGPAELTLTSKELRFATPEGEWIKPWQEIIKVRNTKGYYFIYTDPMQAIVVPQRAFNDTQEKEHFEKQLKKYLATKK